MKRRDFTKKTGLAVAAVSITPSALISEGIAEGRLEGLIDPSVFEAPAVSWAEKSTVEIVDDIVKAAQDIKNDAYRGDGSVSRYVITQIPE